MFHSDVLQSIWSSDIFKFPFQSDVWGTFSDLAMVGVTAYTLYYIRKTFNSQLEVQRMQLKLARIENEKYRLSNMPKFEFEVHTSEYTEENGQYKEHLRIDLILRGSHARHSAVDVRSANAKLIPDETNILAAEDIEMNSRNTINYYVKAPSIIKNGEGIMILVSVLYIDLVYNHYRHDCRILLRKGGMEVSIDELPTFISDTL